MNSIPNPSPNMNVEKCMSSIVRSAGVLCFIVAAWQLIGLLRFLWERREALAGVSGYSGALEVLGGLVVSGTLLCVFGGRLGPWLCKDPTKRRHQRVAPTQQLLAAQSEIEE
jgi:hypothetical protein